ncbi:MAG: DNA-directed RNA polymerase subunit alpha C-terminal domain-containing protein [Candidatus Gastranaerophilales bacterium]|nr:DNA-directed RNA polymerase subunit alpha C-terminal domain-containing protein [Candidatus Gastranaerophilales bacterium]
MEKCQSLLKRVDIRNLGLSLRVSNSLMRVGIKDLHTLLKTHIDDLENIKGFGSKSFKEITDFINKAKTNKDFLLSILQDNNIEITFSVDEFFNNFSTPSKNTDIITELNPNFLVKIIDTPFEEEIKCIFIKQNIKNIGQLITNDIYKLLLQDKTFVLREDGVEICNKIKQYLNTLGVENFPIKFSKEIYKFITYYTLEETLLFGFCKLITEAIEKSFEILDERSFEVIKNRFGIKVSIMTLEQIGKTKNITRERIRQIEGKSIKKLKKYLEKETLLDQLIFAENNIFSEYGAVYKLKDIQCFDGYEKLFDSILGEDISIDTYLNCLCKNKKWYNKFKQSFFSILELNNKNVYDIENIKYLMKLELEKHINNSSETQKDNFNSIFDTIISDFLKHHLIKIDEKNYKFIKAGKLNKKGNISTDIRNIEIISLFKKFYPNGVHLPIDNSLELENNLKLLTDIIPYNMAIRTLSDGIIKASNEVILWDNGHYIHIENVQIRWSMVDKTIDLIISEFNNGIPHFSIKKIYENQSNEYESAGISNTTALLGLIKYKNNPRIGNIKLELYDIEANGDNINKTNIIEEFLKEKKSWVSINDMKKHFCETLGWENYQIEQYVSKSVLAKKETKLGYVHLKVLIQMLNKSALQELLELLYNQTDFTNEPIKLETVRRSSFSRKWKLILGYDVNGNFISDFIDSLNLKNLPLIFYQGSVYPENYISETLVAKYDIAQVIENYNNQNMSEVFFEFKYFNEELLRKIMDSDIKIANVLWDKAFEEMCEFFYKNDLRNLGMLLFFPFHCIKFKKLFTESMINKTIDKVYSRLESLEDKKSEEENNVKISEVFWS